MTLLSIFIQRDKKRKYNKFSGNLNSDHKLNLVRCEVKITRDLVTASSSVQKDSEVCLAECPFFYGILSGISRYRLKSIYTTRFPISFPSLSAKQDFALIKLCRSTRVRLILPPSTCFYQYSADRVYLVHILKGSSLFLHTVLGFISTGVPISVYATKTKRTEKLVQIMKVLEHVLYLWEEFLINFYPLCGFRSLFEFLSLQIQSFKFN